MTVSKLHYKQAKQENNTKSYKCDQGFHHCPGAKGVLYIHAKIAVYQPEARIVHMGENGCPGSNGNDKQTQCRSSIAKVRD